MPDPHSTTVSFFFNDTATTEIYTLSLHDALPIYQTGQGLVGTIDLQSVRPLSKSGRTMAVNGYYDWTQLHQLTPRADRKSTRLNSSHQIISYAVFCLKKKKT